MELNGQDIPDQVADFADPLIGQLVDHFIPLPAAHQNAHIAQDSQLAGYQRLAQSRFPCDITHDHGPFSQGVQDLQSGGISHGFAKIRLDVENGAIHSL